MILKTFVVQIYIKFIESSRDKHKFKDATRRERDIDAQLEFRWIYIAKS